MISEEINQFQDFWNELAPTAKLELLDTIIDKIDVYPDRIWTHLKDEYTELEQELSAQLRTSGSQENTIVLLKPQPSKQIDDAGVKKPLNLEVILHKQY